MALEKKSTADDADKSSEKVSKKSSEKNSAKSAEKGTGSKKGSAPSEKTETKDKTTKDVGSWIEMRYNYARFHSAFEYHTPNEVKREFLGSSRAA